MRQTTISGAFKEFNCDLRVKINFSTGKNKYLSQRARETTKKLAV